MTDPKLTHWVGTVTDAPVSPELGDWMRRVYVDGTAQNGVRITIDAEGEVVEDD